MSIESGFTLANEHVAPERERHELRTRLASSIQRIFLGFLSLLVGDALCACSNSRVIDYRRDMEIAARCDIAGGVAFDHVSPGPKAFEEQVSLNKVMLIAEKRFIADGKRLKYDEDRSLGDLFPLEDQLRKKAKSDPHLLKEFQDDCEISVQQKIAPWSQEVLH